MSNYSTFEPLSYIRQKYSSMSDYLALPLRELHDLFQSYTNPHTTESSKSGGGGIKVLEYGCGPIPIYLCSAPIKATEIVFAEYETRNRDILQSWLEDQPTAPNYTPIFKYVVQDLEGQDGEESVLKRQEDLRGLVKAVVPCDVTKDPPIDINYQGPYDIIVCSLCLAVAASNITEYTQYVRRVSTLLKPGGKLVINSVEARNRQSHFDYWVGDEKFVSLSLSLDSLLEVLQETHFINFQVTYRSVDDTPGLIKYVSPEALATILVIATKK